MLLDSQVFATAALMSAYVGTSYVTFVLSYTTYFPGIDTSTLSTSNLANVAATWFVATYRRSFATPAFAGMLELLTAKYGYSYNSDAGVPASVTMACLAIPDAFLNSVVCLLFGFNSVLKLSSIELLGIS